MRRVAAGGSHCNCPDGLDLRTGPHTGLTGNGIGIVEPGRAQRSLRRAGARVPRWLGHRAEDPRLHPRGSGISIGHPIGATGLRMLATLAHELPALDGSLTLETMCIGGGQALAAVFERV